MIIHAAKLTLIEPMSYSHLKIAMYPVHLPMVLHRMECDGSMHLPVLQSAGVRQVAAAVVVQNGLHLENGRRLINIGKLKF